MPLFAFLLLFCCFLLSLAGAFFAVPRAVRGRISPPRLQEKLNLALFAGLTLACFILTAALAACNFSFVYAVFHTDRGLPLFYRLTALWGGQEGALLFWAWCAALFAVLFQRGKGYKSLSAETQRWYWSILLSVMGFFFLLLTSWNNPFLSASPVPADGFGLNPILQNPGMIFHPPLLFLGYGAFTVPSCLAPAALLSLRGHGGKKNVSATAPAPWAALTRPFILAAWLLLGAGLILGAWWSYMELGWGGYWGWDPVENSSLVPWLLATAYLHTALVENARGKLYRTNAFLMTLVTVSAFFSTYLVRGGIIRSVHAFGQSPAGAPLLVFVLLFLGFAVFSAITAPRRGEPLDTPLTREGLLTCTAWVFLALALVVTVGTLWPVISRLWSEKPVGLSPVFYNTVCMPLFALLAAALAACPWIGWNGRIRRKGPAIFVLAIGLTAAAMLAHAGFSRPLALIGSALAVAIMAGTCMLLAASPGMPRLSPFLAAHGTHFAFALMVLGVAFSGPYKTQRDIVLKPGRQAVFGGYALLLASVGGGDSHDHEPGRGSGMNHPDHAASPPKYIYTEAVVRVTKDGAAVGDLRPQLRRYQGYPDSVFSEVDTIFSWGNELYSSLIGIEEDGTATIQISLNPLVNWIWAGGALLCLFPLAGLSRRTKAPDGEA